MEVHSLKIVFNKICKINIKNYQCSVTYTKSENNKFLNLPNDIDDITRIHLEKSKIFILECLEKENLFLTLNEIGISEKN